MAVRRLLCVQKLAKFLAVKQRMTNPKVISTCFIG